jgi:hypothetical protein
LHATGMLHSLSLGRVPGVKPAGTTTSGTDEIVCPRRVKRLTLHLPSLADLGRETSLDGSDTSSRTARL